MWFTYNIDLVGTGETDVVETGSRDPQSSRRSRPGLVYGDGVKNGLLDYRTVPRLRSTTSVDVSLEYAH